MGPSEILVILLILIAVVGGSAISGLILWGLARGLGKIENATFLNSWGLTWIISIINAIVYLVFWGISALIIQNLVSMNYRSGFETAAAIQFITTLVYYVVSFFITLSITKSHWNCTMKQAFMTHLVPLIISIVFVLIGVLLIISAPSYY
tara:strand:- start:288 stop:737 length:450 start_codon:yes stop_codon:yes gene_type:complete